MTFPKKILLIDPEPHELVRTALEQTGKYLIREEHDSRCAVSAARWFQPNLILFETAAAAADANAIAQQFQCDRSLSDVPVVFVSVGQGADGRVASGAILSGYTFFAQPVGVEELIRWIAELLGVCAD